MGTIVKAENSVKEIVGDFFLEVSWAKFAKKYFEKSPSWIYHKMDGIDGNKKETEFTAKEKELFKNGLFDLAERIRKAAELL